MKVKKFFAKLNDELNSAVPPMSDDLKEMPITVSQFAPAETDEQSEKTSKFNFAQFFSPKRLGLIATAFVIAFVALFSVISFTGKNGVSNQVIVKLNINPSVELVLDEDMKVEKVVSDNADGDLILKIEGFSDSLIGLELKEAVKQIANKATELGFIDYKKDGQNGEYNQLTISASGNKKRLPKDLLSETQEYVVEFFNQSGIYLFVETVEEYSDNFKNVLDELNQKHTYYLQSIEQSATSLKEYATELIFDYCNNLLTLSLEKYDLLMEIKSLNDQVKSAQDSWFAQGAWNYTGDNAEILAIIAKLNEKVELYNQKFDEKLDSEIALNTALGFYVFVSDEDINALKEIANNKIDETFFSLENEYWLTFTSIAVEDFIEDVVEFYKTLSSSVENVFYEMVNLLTQKIEGIREHASITPDLEKISEEDYLNFYNNVANNKSSSNK